MRKYAVPCTISLLVAALYNIVDQIFIANASYLGSYGNAANTVVYPMTIIALAVAVMIGDGTCAFVSISMGSGRTKDAGNSIGSAILMTLTASIIIMVIYLCFSTRILNAFGGSVNKQTFQLAKEYFFWIAVGVPFYSFGQSMNPIIRSDGSPRFAMAATLSGCVANIILDPIFIFAFRWGMMGAALATVIGQVITAVLSAYYMMHMKAVKLDINCFRFYLGLMKRYLPLGMTSFLSQISLVAAMATINNMLQHYGALDPIYGQAQYAAIPMAVVGIVMKFFQIIISISVGTAAGCIPVVGYNYGAGRKGRVRELYTKLLIVEALTGAIATVIVEFFQNQLIGIFGAANESICYTQFAIKSFRIYLCLMTLATVNKANFIFMQSMGKAKISTILSLIREVVFGVGFALILPVFYGLDGVLYSMPAADILTFAITVIVIKSTYKELSADHCETDREVIRV